MFSGWGNIFHYFTGIYLVFSLLGDYFRIPLLNCGSLMISEEVEVLVNIKKLCLQTIPLVTKFTTSLASMLGNSKFGSMALTQILTAEKMKYLTLLLFPYKHSPIFETGFTRTFRRFFTEISMIWLKWYRGINFTMIAAATCNQTHTLRWKSSNEIRPIKDKKQ